MPENWKPIAGFEGLYDVSDLGRVRSLARIDPRGRKVSGRMLAIATHPSGHQQVKLNRNGRRHQAKVHRLVLIAFVGPAPEGCEVLHNDGDPANNAVANLRWGTRSENLFDRVRHGVHHQANKTHCPQRHPYDATNTYVASDGRRMCKECLRIRCRQYRQQKAS